MKTIHAAVTAASLALVTGCALNAANNGTPGSPAVTQPDVPGTVVTVIFENESAQDVQGAQLPFFTKLQTIAGTADAYISSTHPSLPNYIQLTAGDKKGISNNNDPLQNLSIPGNDNLADQLEASGITWRAYMESMGTPCRFDSDKLYSAHHNPFIYYDSIAKNEARCQEHVVDYDQNFEADLASGKYRYMWVTPNMCNNMHDCPKDQADKWLQHFVEQVQASAGYQNGGAIFVTFDEGSTRILGASADLPTYILSPKLVSPGYRTSTRFDHRSYLATIEDIFRIPRLPTTQGAVPMNEFFVHAAQ